jgi:zinc and cadmium transporter
VPLPATLVALSLAGSLGGLALASVVLLLGERIRRRALPLLVSYAVGTLLGVALLALVPEALARLGPRPVLATLLGGILGFFMLEKFVLWRHCHTAECREHDEAGAALILLGGAFHNFADGALIGAAALTSLPLGVSTALAVAAHQIPQEIGDFAILLNAGYSRRQALAWNILSGAAAVPGALAVYGAAGSIPLLLPYVLAVAAGSFLYVAMADLIPDLHRVPVGALAIQQILCLAAGIATILAL